MKSYTDIEQSKKLSKILPLESADMYYYTVNGDLYKTPNVIESEYDLDVDENSVPCWSLAALLDILPNIQEFYPIIEKINDKYVCRYKESGIWINADNPIDTCVDMIIGLPELDLL